MEATIQHTLTYFAARGDRIHAGGPTRRRKGGHRNSHNSPIMDIHHCGLPTGTHQLIIFIELILCIDEATGKRTNKTHARKKRIHRPMVETHISQFLSLLSLFFSLVQLSS
jgi:hypothetical protein